MNSFKQTCTSMSHIGVKINLPNKNDSNSSYLTLFPLDEEGHG